MNNIKARIRSYKQLVSYRKKVNDNLENLWYELTGVKGVRYNSVRYGYNKQLNEERRLTLQDEIYKLEVALTSIDARIAHIEQVLALLNEEDHWLITYTLIDGNTFEDAGRKIYLTKSAVSKRIDTAILNAEKQLSTLNG